jgi:hypothetical protein
MNLKGERALALEADDKIRELGNPSHSTTGNAWGIPGESRPEMAGAITPSLEQLTRHHDSGVEKGSAVGVGPVLAAVCACLCLADAITNAAKNTSPVRSQKSASLCSVLSAMVCP